MQNYRCLVFYISIMLSACAASGGLDDLRRSARTDDPERRIEWAARALDQGGLSPADRAMAYNNICWGHAQIGDLEPALAACDQAVRIDPACSWAYVNRAYIQNERAEFQRAIADCDRAIELAPDNATAYVNRGFAWNQINEFDRALADSEIALKLEPQNAAALINRGHAWHEKGEYLKALEDCNQAVLADPTYILAYNSLAYLLATCPDKSLRDGPRAVRLARKALAMSPGNPMIWDTLAMSLAEAGMVREAVETQIKAIELLDRSGTPKEKRRRASYVEHLEKLKAGLARHRGSRRAGGD